MNTMTLKNYGLFTSISVAGAGITFSLFLFMAYLVKSDQIAPPIELPPIPVEIAQTPKESKANEIKRALPTPPPLPELTSLETEAIETASVGGGIGYDMPTVVNKTAGPDISYNNAINDGDARPVVQVNPDYPLQALRDGIEGWVKLSFNISEIGTVEDVRIIDAQPKRIFDKSARKALRKWKYQPKTENGKKIKQLGLSVQLDFSIDGKRK